MSVERPPLLLTADDFGLSPGVNREIVALLERGALNAVSLFAHSPFADDALDDWARALDRREKNGENASNAPSLGLHFCLTSGRPVAPPEDVPLLVDGAGRFCLGFLSLIRLLRSSKRDEAIRQIERELTAQIRRLDDLTAARGLRWNRLDSHCHLHAIPGIFELVATAARNRGLFLRIPREPLRLGARRRRAIFSDFGVGWAKKALLDALTRRRETEFSEFFAATEYFGVVDSGKMNADRLDAIFAEIAAAQKRETSAARRAKTIEINFHPWRQNATTAAEFDRFGASDADRKFATSPRRAVEWETLATRS